MFASVTALAVVPTSGQSLPNGTLVEGKCKDSVGQDVVGEQWTLNTNDPRRVNAAPGTELAPMSIPPSLVPYGDFQLGREALGEHSHIFPDFEYEEAGHVFDPRFSARWDWFYFDQWAVKFQGGSEGYSYMRNNKPCAQQVAEDTSADTPGADHEHPPLGSYAGAFPGESVSQGHGLALQRPGPYALDQWTLRVHYKHVSAAEFKAHPFLARALGEPKGACSGTKIFDENAIKKAEEEGESFESERVKAAFIYLEELEDDYRVAGPAPVAEWKAETYCLEGSATPFVVTGAHGAGQLQRRHVAVADFAVHQPVRGRLAAGPAGRLAGPAARRAGLRAGISADGHARLAGERRA